MISVPYLYESQGKSFEEGTHISFMGAQSSNPSKCTILSIARSSAIHKFYTLCGTVLLHVNEAKYLGVTLSDDLQWSKHISNLSVKASSTLGLLRRNLSQCPQALREQAYISLIRSRLEYCSANGTPTWSKI